VFQFCYYKNPYLVFLSLYFNIISFCLFVKQITTQQPKTIRFKLEKTNHQKNSKIGNFSF